MRATLAARRRLRDFSGRCGRFRSGAPHSADRAAVSAYQAICFRVWGITPVHRRDDFAIDRHKLSYLNAIEKGHCLFCSYVNGLIAYVREVAARFSDYGDAAGYRRSVPTLRSALKKVH